MRETNQRDGAVDEEWLYLAVRSAFDARASRVRRAIYTPSRVALDRVGSFRSLSRFRATRTRASPLAWAGPWLQSLPVEAEDYPARRVGRASDESHPEAREAVHASIQPAGLACRGLLSMTAPSREQYARCPGQRTYPCAPPNLLLACSYRFMSDKYCRPVSAICQILGWMPVILRQQSREPYWQLASVGTLFCGAGYSPFTRLAIT